MTTNGRNITNDRLYDALNAMRLELKGDIRDLRNQFDSLEAGRLTRLEENYRRLSIDLIKQHNSQDQNQAVLSTKFLVVQTIAYVILFVILQAVANRLFK